MSVINVHHVDSELAVTETLKGSRAYELTLDDVLLHTDAVTDAGVASSLRNPDPNSLVHEHEHHVHALGSYEFDARVPLEDLTPSNHSRVHLRLFRRERDLDIAPRGTRVERCATGAEDEVTLIGLPRKVLRK